jgi:hypothetical protein
MRLTVSVVPPRVKACMISMRIFEILQRRSIVSIVKSNRSSPSSNGTIVGLLRILELE